MQQGCDEQIIQQLIDAAERVAEMYRKRKVVIVVDARPFIDPGQKAVLLVQGHRIPFSFSRGKANQSLIEWVLDNVTNTLKAINAMGCKSSYPMPSWCNIPQAF